MSENSIAGLSVKQIEEYLFSNDNLVPDSTKLIKGTETYYFVTLLNYLKSNVRLDIPTENKHAYQLFQDYKANFPKSANFAKIQLRSWFIAYDKEKFEEKRKEVLGNITNGLEEHDILAQLNDEKAMLDEKQHRINENRNLSELDLSSFDIKEHLKKAAKNVFFLSNLKRKMWPQVSLFETTRDVLMLIIDQGELHAFGNHIVDKINKILLEKDSHDQQKILSNIGSIVSRLSVEQIQYWLKINIALVNYYVFVQHYVFKVFSKELDFEIYLQSFSGTFPPTSKLKKKLENLLKIWEFATTLPKLYHLLQKSLLFEILRVKLLLQDSDFKLFLFYLKEFHQEKLLPTTDYSQFTLDMSSGVTPMSEIEIITSYLMEFFKVEDEKSISLFEGTLDKSILQRTFAKTKLLYEISGQNDPQHIEILRSFESEEVLKKAEIVIRTKELADSAKVPTFELEVKNITELNLKVFELDVENYFRVNKQPIHPEISVEGITPNILKSFNISNANPFKFYPITCTLDELKDKKGWFIIEFSAKDLKRLVSLKNGSLKYIRRETGAGNLFMIINDKNEICKDSSVLYENKLYRSNDKGHITIPYAKHADSRAYALLKADGIYEVISFDQKRESYQLQTRFLLESSGIVTNSEASVLVQPRLYVNQFQTTLQLLRNPKLLVSVTNDRDIRNTIEEFTNFAFERETDFVQRFRVPPTIKEIEFKFSAEIFNNVQDNWESLSSETTYVLENSRIEDNRIVFFDFQLVRYQDNYKIIALGKNGERIQGLDVEIALIHEACSNKFKQLLQTSSEGEVLLGSLENFETLEIQTVQKIAIPKVQKTWNLNILSRPIHHSSKELYAVEGEALYFEFEKVPGLNLSYFSLQEFNSFGDTYLRNHDRSLRSQEENGLLIITFPRAKEGVYLLQNHFVQESLKINVVEGFRLANNSLIYSTKSNLVIENVLKMNTAPKICGILSSSDSLKLALKKISGNVRVHAIGLPYLPSCETYPAIVKAYNSNLNTHEPLRDLQTLQNNLTVSASLKDEVVGYVESRRNLPKVMGSVLTKPSYLLDPSETVFKLDHRRVLERSDNGVVTFTMDNREQFERRSANSTNSLSLRANYQGGYEEFCNFKSKNSDHWNDRITYRQLFLQNHLRFPAKIVGCFKPNQNGEVIINKNDLNFDNYTSLQLLVCTPEFSSNYFLDLNTLGPHSKHLTIRQTLNQNLTYAESKKHLMLAEGKQFTLSNPLSSQVEIIDDVKKLLKLQTDICKSIGGKRAETEEAFGTWEFIARWHQLTLEQKNSYFDKFSSHELHFYLFMKDPVYFEKVVKEHLRNKVERRIVDEFLLGNDITKFASPSKIGQFNVFEKCLVIAQLATNNCISEAKAIADLIRWEDENEGKTRYCQELDDKIFELILGTGYDNIFPKQIESTLENPKRDNGNNYGYDHRPPQDPSISYNRPMHARYTQKSRGFNWNFALCETAQEMNYETEMELQMESKFSPQGFYDSSNACYEEEKSFARYPQRVVPACLAEGREYNDEECQFFGGAIMDDGKKALFSELDVVQARKQNEIYTDLEKTRECSETHYHGIKNSTEFQNLIKANRFWVSFSEWLIENKGNLTGTFLSADFKYAHQNFTEIILVLAITSIPLAAGLHLYESTNDAKLLITLQSHAVIFFRELTESVFEELDNQDLMILKRYFDPNDKFDVLSNGRKSEKIVEEFFAQRPYGCEIVITNFSSKILITDLFYQIPSNCLPLVQEMNEQTLRNEAIQSYSSKAYQFFFYAPNECESLQVPVYLNRELKTIYRSSIQEFQFRHPKHMTRNIEEEVNEASIEHCSISALFELFTQQYFKPKLKNNLKEMILSKLKSNLFDPSLYAKVLGYLRERCIYDSIIWKYAFYHSDNETLREYFDALLESNPNITRRIGHGLKTTLVDTTYSFEIESTYAIISTDQLQIGGKRKEEYNDPSYRKLLLSLLEKGTIDNVSRLKLAIIWTNGGRECQAYEMLKKIDPKDLDETGNLQYDYLFCYLDSKFDSVGMDEAKEISSRYLNYPITR